MADIESAEAYAARLCGHIVDSLLGSSRPVASKTEALRIITARDNAVANQARLGLLVEIRSLAKMTKWIAADGVSKEAAWGRAFLAATKELEAKYAPKAGG